MDSLINADLRAISQILNFDLTVLDPAFLNKIFKERIKNSNVETVAHYESILQNDHSEISLLRSELFISYSGFFRDSLTWSFVQQKLLPSIASDLTKEVRIWSVACSAGQEAYTMAMLIDEFNVLNKKNINYRIFATDINEGLIRFAENGVYPLEMLGNISLKRFSDYFEKRDDQRYQLKAELKNKTQFSVFNILSNNLFSPSGSVFGDFDVILCCNVLFYYDTATRKKIVSKLLHSINEGGYILTTESEALLFEKSLSRVYPYVPLLKK